MWRLSWHDVFFATHLIPTIGVINIQKQSGTIHFFKLRSAAADCQGNGLRVSSSFPQNHDSDAALERREKSKHLTSNWHRLTICPSGTTSYLRLGNTTQPQPTKPRSTMKRISKSTLASKQLNELRSPFPYKSIPSWKIRRPEKDVHWSGKRLAPKSTVVQ